MEPRSMVGSAWNGCGLTLALTLALMQGGCSPQDGDNVDLITLPPARVTLAAVAKRLGQTKNPGDLTRIALRSSAVVAELTSAERSILGRSSVRFQIDRPAVVAVAVPRRSEPPFWLADQRFQPTGQTVHDRDGVGFVVYERRFGAGLVGLGVNALDRLNEAHYALFVRTPGEGVPAIITPIGPEWATIQPSGRSVSPFEDVDRPLVDLPDALARGQVVLTRQADRADGALLPLGRAWKTRQPSSPRPDQVVASFGLDPSQSLTVSWRTDPSVTRSVARFRAESGSGAGDLPVEVPGVAEPISSDGLLNDPTILRHRVVASGLAPDTRYRYAVGDGTAAGWSEWYATRTAPRERRDFRFLYLGDAQCELERWGELAHGAVRANPDAGFLLLAGDLVDRGNERSNWDHFFLRGAGVFDAIPFMPAVGNHEYLDKGPVIYRKTFPLPRNGPSGIDPNLAYSFEYSDAFVAVLDSTLAIHDPASAASQADWLDQALKQTRATWKFVTFHHPVYASHPSRANPELERVWGPVFDRHHVDLVLTGHDHAYLRSAPMKGGQIMTHCSAGTVYVVSVSGEKFYGQIARDYIAKGMTQVATYQTIDVEVASRRLRYRSFDRSGLEVDSLTIEKSNETSRSPERIGRSR